MKIRKIAFIALGALATLTTGSLADEEKSLMVFKSPWCGCCEVWTDAAKEAGYDVVIEDLDDLTAIKKQAGVPEDMQACHTAVVGGDRKYVIEGHVPLEAIQKMMTERPDIRGIAVPGMPQGSLGMGFDPTAKYTVYVLDHKADGAPRPYMTMGE